MARKNAIEMYSTYNEGKSIVTERFIRTFKNNLQNVYIDKLDGIVNKYNKTYSTAKMKLIDVKSNTYITLVKKIMIKILNLKLVILLEY